MEFTLDGPVGTAEAAWRRIADLDALALSGGLPPLNYSTTLGHDGFPALTGTLLGPAGIRHAFEEHDHGWVRGRRVWQNRRIDGPLLAGARFLGEVVASDGGFLPRLSFSAVPTSFMASPAVSLLVRGLRRQWRALLARPATDVPRRRFDLTSRAAIDRWKRRGAPDPLVARFVAWLEGIADADLPYVRPLELARAWEMDDRDVLAWLLEGTAAGLVAPSFEAHCPLCTAGSRSVSTLSRLVERMRCPSCGVEYDVDLRDSVEVSLVALPRVAPRQDEQWATWLARRRPHVAVFSALAPGECMVLDVELPEGSWKVSAGEGFAEVRLQVEGGAPDHATWTAGSAATMRLAPGPARLTLDNASARRLRVSVVRAGTDEDRLTGARLATSPTFRGIFGTQTLSPGVHLGTSRIAILVTDLVASHRLYKAVGDRLALSFVAGHLVFLEEEIDRMGGVRVKTVGDSLVAVFDRTDDAARAALALPALYRRWCAGRADTAAPPLRVGVAAGPAIAAHSDSSGLDWFGGTANLAVSASRIARGEQVVWTDSVHTSLDAVPAGWAATAVPVEDTEGGMWRLTAG
jgi:class 3 adenylate cyclase